MIVKETWFIDKASNPWQRKWTSVPKNPFPLVSQGRELLQGEFPGYTRSWGATAEQHRQPQQLSRDAPWGDLISVTLITLSSVTLHIRGQFVPASCHFLTCARRSSFCHVCSPIIMLLTTSSWLGLSVCKTAKGILLRMLPPALTESKAFCLMTVILSC